MVAQLLPLQRLENVVRSLISAGVQSLSMYEFMCVYEDAWVCVCTHMCVSGCTRVERKSVYVSIWKETWK